MGMSVILQESCTRERRLAGERHNHAFRTKSSCGILGAIVPSPLAKIYFLYLRLWFFDPFYFPSCNENIRCLEMSCSVFLILRNAFV